MKERITCFIYLILLGLFSVSCATSSGQDKKGIQEEVKNDARVEKQIYKGEDISLVVMQPCLTDVSDSEKWIARYIQESLVNKFSTFTQMYIANTENDDLEYSEDFFAIADNYYVNNLASGSIQETINDYEFNFFIVDIQNNENSSSAECHYSLADIESGRAVNDITIKLLKGLGINLSASDMRTLTATNTEENTALILLAKAYVAEKAGNLVEAIAYYFEVKGTYQERAYSNIKRILYFPIPKGSLEEKSEYLQATQKTWSKMFKDLDSYLSLKLPVVIYNFSSVTKELNSDLKTSRFTVEPGMKIIPNRLAITVWKEIMDAWEGIKAEKEFAPLVKNLHGASQQLSQVQHTYIAVAGLVDEEGVRARTPGYGEITQKIILQYSKTFEIKSRKKYFNDREYRKLNFNNVQLSEVEGELVPEVFSLEKSYGGGGTPNVKLETPLVFSEAEWE